MPIINWILDTGNPGPDLACKGIFSSYKFHNFTNQDYFPAMSRQGGLETILFKKSFWIQYSLEEKIMGYKLQRTNDK